MTEVVFWVIGADPASNHRDAELGEAVGQGLVERRTAYAQAGAGAEAGVDLVVGVEVSDAVERPARQAPPPRPVQILDGAVGDALAASLVDGSRARLDDHDGQTGQCRADRGRRAGGTGAGDQEIDHLSRAEFRAASSVRIRIASRGMLSTVKTSAVIHAVWTSGNAMPSATTAT